MSGHMISRRIERRQIPGPPTFFDDAGDKLLRSDERILPPLLPRPVDVGHDNLIRIRERLGEFLEKNAGTGVLVRLKHDPDALGLVPVAGRLDRYADLGGVMGVIVDNLHPAALSPPS